MGDESLIVRTDESLSPAPEIGATIHVTPREDRLHWFDAETGKRI
jgi:sn-glycerol 3-phosphate transport system ATP-binding protein